MSYLYGMNDQIRKGYSALRVTPGGPHFLDSQGLNPEGLGGDSSPSMSEEAFPGSNPSWAMDISALGADPEGTGTSGYGGRVRADGGAGLGDPRAIVERSAQAFSAGAHDRIHKLHMLSKLTRHPAGARVRQLGTAAERYIAAPQYHDQLEPIGSAQTHEMMQSGSSQVVEVPEPNTAHATTIGVLLNAAVTQAQIDAVKASNRISLATINATRALASQAAGLSSGRIPTSNVIAAPTPPKTSSLGIILGGLAGIALVGLLFHFAKGRVTR